MSEIKGVIEAVSCKAGKPHPKYGPSWQVGIKVDGEWYGAFTKKDAEALGLAAGRVVVFTKVVNGEYVNFDPKSLVVSGDAKATEGSKGSAGGVTGKGANIDRNIARGQAVNNAVALYVNGKVDSLLAGLKEAVTLHAVAEVYFDRLLAKVDVDAVAQGSVPKEAAAAPAQPPAKKAAPKKAAPPPPPEPEPESSPEQADQTSDFYDDDIPF